MENIDYNIVTATLKTIGYKGFMQCQLEDIAVELRVDEEYLLKRFECLENLYSFCLKTIEQSLIKGSTLYSILIETNIKYLHKMAKECNQHCIFITLNPFIPISFF